MQAHLIRAFAVVVVLSTFFVATARAQATLSLRGGATIATLGGDDVTEADSRTGMNVGAALTFGVSDNLGLQVGAAYVQKGGTATIDGAAATFRLDYVEFPVLLSLGIPTRGSISPRFFLGPAFSVEAGCEVDGTDQGVTVTVACNAFGSPVKSIDVGAMGGAGLSIATGGSLAVTIDVVYDLGQSTIDDSGNPDDVKNRAWSILAGVSFPVGRG